MTNAEYLKSTELAESEGFASSADMLKVFAYESVMPGICMNESCDYTAMVRPDARKEWCGFCETNSIRSCLSLEGVV